MTESKSVEVALDIENSSDKSNSGKPESENESQGKRSNQRDQEGSAQKDQNDNVRTNIKSFILKVEN